MERDGTGKEGAPEEERGGTRRTVSTMCAGCTHGRCAQRTGGSLQAGRQAAAVRCEKVGEFRGGHSMLSAIQYLLYQ